MPLDPDVTNAAGRAWEKVVEKHVERKLRVKCVRLDLGTPATRNRPDFRLDDLTSGEPIALVEAKTVHSAGYDRKRKAHISTLDPALVASSPEFDPHEDLDELDEQELLDRLIVAPGVAPNYDEAIADARRKYICTTRECSELAGLPYLVAFLGDWWAPTDLVDRRQAPEISGFLLLEVDRERDVALRRESLEQLGRRADTGDQRRLPPPAKEWRLVRNRRAANPVPDQIGLHCLDGYPEDPD
jgi:hypothetical protein